MSVGGPQVVFFPATFDSGLDSCTFYGDVVMSLRPRAHQEPIWEVSSRQGQGTCYPIEVWGSSQEEVVERIQEFRDKFPDLHCSYHATSWAQVRYSDADCFVLKFNLMLLQSTGAESFIGPMPSLSLCLLRLPVVDEEG